MAFLEMLITTRVRTSVLDSQEGQCCRMRNYHQTRGCYLPVTDPSAETFSTQDSRSSPGISSSRLEIVRITGKVKHVLEG